MKSGAVISSALLVALLVVVMLLASLNREPTYEGMALSHWIDQPP